jgi:hypothetical protein
MIKKNIYTQKNKNIQNLIQGAACSFPSASATVFLNNSRVEFNSFHRQIDLNYMIMQIVCLLCSALAS